MNLKINTRRYGIVEINESVYAEFWDSNINIFIPLRIEFMKHTANYFIHAYSEDFKLLKEGDAIPTYKPIFKKLGSNQITFEGFEEVKP